MTHGKLSEETVKRLPVPDKGNRVTYFAGATIQGAKAPRGFGVRVTAAGARAFVLNYRLRVANTGSQSEHGPIGPRSKPSGKPEIYASASIGAKTRLPIAPPPRPRQASPQFSMNSWLDMSAIPSNHCANALRTNTKARSIGS